MQSPLPFTQIRIARPTDQLEKVVDFYKKGLDLPEIGRFADHAGFSGVMLGMPDAAYHLEFTQHVNGSPCPAPTKDNLLVFYYPDAHSRDHYVAQLAHMGYHEVEPENPYWLTNGITIADPDGWRVVLMRVGSFNQA